MVLSNQLLAVVQIRKRSRKMTDKCFICNCLLQKDNIYLCQKHTQELFDSYSVSSSNNVIQMPSEKEHCHLCGEYKDRMIIYYKNWFYLCDFCLNDAMKEYNIQE